MFFFFHWKKMDTRHKFINCFKCTRLKTLSQFKDWSWRKKYYYLLYVLLPENLRSVKLVFFKPNNDKIFLEILTIAKFRCVFGFNLQMLISSRSIWCNSHNTEKETKRDVYSYSMKLQNGFYVIFFFKIS